MQLIDKEAVESILDNNKINQLDNHGQMTLCISPNAIKEISSLPVYGETEALEVIKDLVTQFAYESKDGLHTGGLSTLERAFDYLEWDDPHKITPPNQ